jgi:hypothetical protein
MRRITQDFNTCGDTIISSSCVIYPNSDLTLLCPDLCFPSNLTDIIKCINDSISLTGLDLKCAAPNCVNCFEYTIKNVLQLLLDKVCVPFDCAAAKACIDCDYIRSCITIPTPEPRITCNEIKATGCVDCAYINSCVTPYTLNCLTVQGCVGVQYLETTLAQSFDFATYNITSGMFNLDCTAVKDCIDCDYIRSCIPAVTCDQVLPCISCAFLQSKIDQVGCLTFPTPDVKTSSPYIYFKTTKDEFNDTVINNFEAIEQVPTSGLCTGVTYELFNAKTNLSLVSGTLAAIETYMNNNYSTTVTNGVISNSGTMAAPGIYHLQIKSTCSGNTYVGNEIQFEIISFSTTNITQTIVNAKEFNDSTVSDSWVAGDNSGVSNNHYYCLYYVNGSTMLTPNNVEINTYGFRSTFNNSSAPGVNVVNSTNINANPYVWIGNFKKWITDFDNNITFKNKTSGAITVQIAGTSATINTFRIRLSNTTLIPSKISSAGNYGSEINQINYTTLNGVFTNDPGHNFTFTSIKLTKPI